MFSKIKNFLNIIMEHSYKVITKDCDNNDRECYFCTLFQVSQYLSAMCAANIDVNIIRKLITKEINVNTKRYENTAPALLFKKFPYIEITCEKIVRYNEGNCRKNKFYQVYRDKVKICHGYSVVEIANRLKLSEATIYRIINGYYDNAVTEKTKFLQKYKITVTNLTETAETSETNTETSIEGNLPFDVSI